MALVLEKFIIEGFGKFNNQDFTFFPGLNLVYGENESGKSTLHQALGAMFYGFVKPNLKTTRLYEQYNRYEPLNSSMYKGILIFTQDDRQYRLERDFLKKEYRLYDNKTHEDLTLDLSSIDQGLDAPGNVFFNMSYNGFKNLIFIQQDHRALGDKDFRDIQESIRDLTLSTGEDISLEKALNKLEDQRSNIGTAQSSTKIYGQLEREKNELLLKRQQIQQRLQEKSEILKEKLVIEKNLHQYEEKFEKYSIEIAKKRDAHKKLLQREIERLTEKKQEYESQLKKLESYHVESNDENQLIELIDKEQRILQKESLYTERERILKDTITPIDVLNTPQDIGKDLELHSKLEHQFQEAYEELQQNKKGKSIQSTAFIVFGLILCIVALLGILKISEHLKIVFTLMMIPGVILLLYGIISLRRFNANNNTAKLDHTKDLIEELYRKYNCNGRKDFLNFAFEQQKTFNEFQAKTKYVDKLKNELAEVNELKDKLEIEKTSIQEAYDVLYEKYQVDNTQKLQTLFLDVKKIPNIKLKCEKIESDIRYFKNLLHNLDQGQNIAETSNATINPLLNTSDLEKEKEQIEKEIEALNLQLEHLRGKLDVQVQEYDELERIESNLAVINEMQLDLDHRKYLIEETKGFLLKSSKKLEKELLPKLSEIANPMLFFVTEERYDKLIIDSGFNISVEESDSLTRYPLDRLSMGTREQVYFVFRLALMKLITKSSYPILLDESFVQYDDKRLLSVFKLLLELSKEQQIIFFTSKHTDVKLMQNLNGQMNLLEL